ncbi:tetratricopeptide repeat protein [Qipengyuania atrilutea]|uniref:Tetratricopeptide repeat protein n=1 Tax=Qipengyuania atrilutea TaxID=2744473 RepID=A0A850H3Y5_9SPHN|nr:tetratricopeptide repeat protein [Actirhodobacter atriluteus]NVD44583.1 tetratricopeptide repeat protein [Actirhodobacter atriluteus]
MILTALVPLLLMQVGPDPTASDLPDLPIDPEGRARSQRAEEAIPQARPAVPPRLRECLQSVRADPAAAEREAMSWLGEAGGSDAALAGQCLGMAHYVRGEFAEAQTAFMEARDRVPESDPDMRARLGTLAGNAALVSNDYEGAVAALNAVVEDARTAEDTAAMGQAQIDRARALVALNRSEEAAAALTEAREALPENADAWLFSATLSRRLNRLANAQEQIERAAMLAPRSAAIGLEAGVIAATARRYDDAQRSFESVLLVAPDSSEASRARAYLEQLGVPRADQPDTDEAPTR